MKSGDGERPLVEIGEVRLFPALKGAIIVYWVNYMCVFVCACASICSLPCCSSAEFFDPELINDILQWYILGMESAGA